MPNVDLVVINPIKPMVSMYGGISSYTCHKNQTGVGYGVGKYTWHPMGNRSTKALPLPKTNSKASSRIVSLHHHFQGRTGC